MIVRRATVDDAKRIQEITITSLGYDIISLEKIKKQLEKIVSQKHQIVLVACDDNEVIGYLHGTDYECIYNESLKNIISLAVDTGKQSSGVGKALLSEFESWAKEEGATGVRLVSSSQRVKAHGFYQHCGYQVRKVQKNFIKYFDKK